MANDFEIVLKKYHGTESSVIIPDGVTEIGSHAFDGCTNLISVTIPDSVTKIRDYAFRKCKSLTSVTIPDSVTEIECHAFESCSRLKSIIIPNRVTKLSSGLFETCGHLESIVVPDSVTEIDDHAFFLCPGVTFICGEGSYTHQYCLDNLRPFIFDYQFEAFHGLLPQGYKKLASPFLADEEEPFIFISYSHKDRDTVLPILKTLYESGWKIWYDEGLTIGDRYDETLEAHIRNCSAFLLFVSENSVNSYYCLENEIPLANQYGKPIIRCDLDDEPDFEIREGTVAAAVTPENIGPALEAINGLTRGERREAKGITVVANPADRDGADGDGFAYCLYSGKNSSAAKAILLEAKNGGCSIYDAFKEGANEEKLQSCACMIVFLDHAFLADESLTKTLAEAYLAGRDIAVCQLESITGDDLPQELGGLRKMQWLHFVHGISADMNMKLARHLQKRGCRNTAILPGFEYEKTDKGIVIKRYTGMDPNPHIEKEYGGIPVTEICSNAFSNCAHLKTIVIPDSVTKIGEEAFSECVSLTAVTIPEGVTEIEKSAFYQCYILPSVTVPGSVKELGWSTFNLCTGLTSVTLREGVTVIGDFAFALCLNLPSVTIPDGVKKIGKNAFYGCKNLTSVTIPDSVTEIADTAFSSCPNLTVTCSPDSYAWKYCRENDIPVKSAHI